ncbi:MAG: UPF0182 family protein, partial [Clostridia bacterium]
MKDNMQENNQINTEEKQLQAIPQEETKNVKSENSTKQQKNKVRRRVVLAVLAVVLIIVYIIERGYYLEIKEIGENYVPIFWQNITSMGITAFLNFIAVFSIMYITTNQVKTGLKVFFEDEKKEMPKLPQKSISFIVAIVVTILTSSTILEKALPCFYNTQFVDVDPVLGLDIGYFVFIWPFLELLIIYALIAVVASVIYAAIYYITVFNIYFDGISRETVKKSPILNQVLSKIKIVVVIVALLVLLETQNVGVQKFIVLNNEETTNYSLFGAGITETTIGFWGYIILSGVIVVSAFKAISQFKKGNTKKVLKSILIVPGYLAVLLVVMLGFNLIFVNSNELDKEKTYILANINNTKKAYGIDIDEVLVEYGGTITQSDISENSETINNIPIADESTVLKDLNGSQTSKGYYNYSGTKIGLYSSDGDEQLLYITPREIASSKGTYNNKTYEYTHGFGVILTSATTTTLTGNIN